MTPGSLTSTKIADLDPAYLQFTATPGLLRCIKKDEDHAGAQGLFFACPKCVGTDHQHGVTLLFDLPSVPKKANPPGRWSWNKAPLNLCALKEAIQHKCGLFARVRCGQVMWR